MLTDPEKKLLKDTWRLVVPIMETASDLFYRRLFELQPTYRALFPPDMTAQKRKLMVTLAFVVKSADWAEQAWAEDVAQDDDLFLVVLALGRRHGLLYKIPEDAYPVVGEALLWSLNMGLGQAFTEEARAAWSKLYGLLSSIMLMGTRQAAVA
ncbi:MAG TPA: globin domain-containing protein [Ramlibacter sp.]|nr:globin domain-containing protein [Ramlibacter sp.]